MAPGRPNRDLCVPLQTKTRPRPLADTARNGSCLPDACFALHTIAPAAHDATKASNTKNGRGVRNDFCAEQFELGAKSFDQMGLAISGLPVTMICLFRPASSTR